MFSPVHTKTNTKGKKTDLDTNYAVEIPQYFTLKNTTFFGMISLLTISLLNIPIMLENTYVYGDEGYENNLESLVEHSLVRNHFTNDFPISTNPANTHDGFSLLEERTNVKNHFSYEYTSADNARFIQLEANFHDKR